MQFVYHEKNGEPQYDVGFPIRLQSYDKKKIRDSISFPFEEVNEINDFKFFNITSCGAINGDCSYTEWFVGFYDPPGRRFDLVHPDKNWRVRTYSIKHAICFILDQGKTALLAFMLQFTEDRLAFRTPDIPEEVQTLTELRDWLEDKQLSEERLQQSYVDRVDDAATSSSPMPLAGLSMVTKPEEE
ncbi:hypothetical protein MMC34_003140 [Xylographa carneopallida]|nr:hypothetical protein [Xylographa carneopallida]